MPSCLFRPARDRVVIKLPGIGGPGLTLPPATTEEPPLTLEVAILYESIAQREREGKERKKKEERGGGGRERKKKKGKFGFQIEQLSGKVLRSRLRQKVQKRGVFASKFGGLSRKIYAPGRRALASNDNPACRSSQAV